MKLNNFLAVFLLTAILICPAFSGDTNFNSIFGTKTFSLNGLYFAGVDGLSNVLSNPAGLSYLNKKGIELSVSDQIFTHEFKSTNKGNYQSYNHDNLSVGGGIYWNFSENFTAAVSYTPFTNFQDDWPFLLLRNSDSSQVILAFNLYNRIKINSITPAFAFKKGNFSLGISANIYQVKQEIAFPQGNERWLNNVGLAAYQMEYAIDAWTFGGTLGLMYEVNSDFRIGVKIKSGFSADLKGDAKSTMFAELDSAASLVNVNSTFEIPWSFGGGIVYSLSENLKLNVDAEFSLWGSTKKNLDYNFDNSVWQTGLAQTDTVTGINASSFSLNYKNTVDAGFGLEYSLKEIVYRFGYRFNQSPNSNSTYNYLFPGVDQHIFTLGLGYKDENLTIDAAISYALGISKEVHSSQDQNLFGNYSSSGYLPTLTLKYEL